MLLALCRVSKMDEISPNFPSLYWWPIDSWMQCRLSSLCCGCLSLAAPGCLAGLPETCGPARQLRSSPDASVLCVPTVHTHSPGRGSFSCAAPVVWGTLPCKVRSSNTVSSFESSLEARLFWWSCWLRGGGSEGERERTSGLSQNVRVFFPLILFHIMGLVL